MVVYENFNIFSCVQKSGKCVTKITLDKYILDLGRSELHWFFQMFNKDDYDIQRYLGNSGKRCNIAHRIWPQSHVSQKYLAHVIYGTNPNAKSHCNCLDLIHKGEQEVSCCHIFYGCSYWVGENILTNIFLCCSRDKWLREKFHDIKIIKILPLPNSFGREIDIPSFISPLS